MLLGLHEDLASILVRSLARICPFILMLLGLYSDFIMTITTILLKLLIRCYYDCLHCFIMIVL